MKAKWTNEGKKQKERNEDDKFEACYNWKSENKSLILLCNSKIISWNASERYNKARRFLLGQYPIQQFPAFT